MESDLPEAPERLDLDDDRDRRLRLSLATDETEPQSWTWSCVAAQWGHGSGWLSNLEVGAREAGSAG